MKEWYAFIEEMKTKGIAMQRVRLVKLPLTTYTKYEFAVHEETRKYGDDIKAIMQDVFDRLHVEEKDFWLIDEKTVLLMKYGDRGEFRGFDVTPATKHYSHMKDLLLKNAIDLEQVHGKNAHAQGSGFSEPPLFR